jgi:hypothetical protein
MLVVWTLSILVDHELAGFLTLYAIVQEPLMTLRSRASAALLLMHLLTVSRAIGRPGSRTTAFLYSSALYNDR